MLQGYSIFASNASKKNCSEKLGLVDQILRLLRTQRSDFGEHLAPASDQRPQRSEGCSWCIRGIVLHFYRRQWRKSTRGCVAHLSLFEAFCSCCCGCGCGRAPAGDALRVRDAELVHQQFKREEECREMGSYSGRKTRKAMSCDHSSDSAKDCRNSVLVEV